MKLTTLLVVVRTVMKVLTLEETIELILKHTDYQREDVLKMIGEKREELGPEVVNEESAAMIVARELGIDLQQVSAKARLRIEDITESTRNVTLTAKVLNRGSVRTFTRKGEGSEGKVASLVIADETGQIRVALWDEITKVVSEDIVKIGDVIQIRGGYVRKGLGDALEVNMGRMSGIKVLDEYELEELNIEIGDAPSVKISELEEKMYDVSLVAKIQQVFPLSTFQRDGDEEEGKVLSVIAADDSGSTRIVFWGKDAEEMETSQVGEVIKLSGGYTKTGRYGNIEVHAGRSSRIERGLKTKIDAVEAAPSRPASSPVGKKEIADITSDMRDVDVEGKVVKIFPVNTFDRDGGEGHVQNIIIADESGQTRLTFWNKDVEKIEKLKEGDIVSVSHAYAKDGYRGGVEVHVGRS
ncbi:MAG: OB-fold nucleic acid binding domain-containing protein, partial [Candidatus Thorarchaeota archaeon]